jgi:hypothetical protein
MGRFYFHVRKGDQLAAHDQGQDLPDVSEAVREAQLSARELVAEPVQGGKDRIPDAIVIADEAGRTVETVLFATVLPKAFKV